MKLKDLIENVRRDKDNESYVNLDVLAQHFEMYNFDFWDEQDKLKAYWAGSHICTDTEVGVRIYYFYGEPVAISSQKGRKCQEDFEWVSHADFATVKEYLESINKDENEIDYDLLDEDEDVGEMYLEDDGKGCAWRVQ